MNLEPRPAAVARPLEDALAWVRPEVPVVAATAEVRGAQTAASCSRCVCGPGRISAAGSAFRVRKRGTEVPVEEGYAWRCGADEMKCGCGRAVHDRRIGVVVAVAGRLMASSSSSSGSLEVPSVTFVARRNASMNFVEALVRSVRGTVTCAEIANRATGSATESRGRCIRGAASGRHVGLRREDPRDRGQAEHRLAEQRDPANCTNAQGRLKRNPPRGCLGPVHRSCPERVIRAAPTRLLEPDP